MLDARPPDAYLAKYRVDRFDEIATLDNRQDDRQHPDRACVSRETFEQAA